MGVHLYDDNEAHIFTTPSLDTWVPVCRYRCAETLRQPPIPNRTFLTPQHSRASTDRQMGQGWLAEGRGGTGVLEGSIAVLVLPQSRGHRSFIPKVDVL
jgi:hypothetical protein